MRFYESSLRASTAQLRANVSAQKRRASTVQMHTRVSMVQVRVMRECRITRENAKFLSENWKSHTRTQMF